MKRTASAFLALALGSPASPPSARSWSGASTISSDLRLFLPAPATPEQRLLLEAIGEGPASRVLVVALEGAPAEALADASRALVAALRDDEHFRFVANGELSLDSLPEDLLPYRYLLSPTMDARRFDTELLAQRSERAPATSHRRPDCCSSLGSRAIRRSSS